MSRTGVRPSMLHTDVDRAEFKNITDTMARAQRAKGRGTGASALGYTVQAIRAGAHCERRQGDGHQ